MRTENENPDRFDAGCWLGRAQAVAAVANQCSFAQAECLRKLKESKAHDALGLTWEEFCSQHVGLSRARADGIIQNAREFGESYFRLAEIVPISPHSFRQLPANVEGDAIDFGNGKPIPLIPENAPAIRAAIAQLRAQSRNPDPGGAHGVMFKRLRWRIDSLFAQFALLAAELRSAYDAEQIRDLMTHFRYRHSELENRLRVSGFHL